MRQKRTLSILAIATPLLGMAGAWLMARRLTRRQPADAAASPADYGLAAEDVAFLTDDGITIRGYFIPAPAARGTIIVCSGFNGSLDPDLKYAPAFHARGYNLLFFDYRGHGRSGGDAVTFGCLEPRDLLAGIEWLRRQGIERVGLYGLSMGGAVAMSTAPLSPAVCAVLSDSGFARFETTIAGWLRVRGVPAKLSDGWAQMVVWLAGRRIGASPRDCAPLRSVARIAPRGLLLIHGTEDVHVPLVDAEALFRAAGEPKDLWIVPLAGHREAEQFAGAEYMERVLAFFDRFVPVVPSTAAAEESQWPR